MNINLLPPSFDELTRHAVHAFWHSRNSGTVNAGHEGDDALIFASANTLRSAPTHASGTLAPAATIRRPRREVLRGELFFHCAGMLMVRILRRHGGHASALEMQRIVDRLAGPALSDQWERRAAVDGAAVIQ